MKHLYLAGPYTRPDPIVNTNAAIRLATKLFERHLFIPHVPHLTLLWHMVTPRPIDFWYLLDTHHLSICQAVMRLPGDSTGADREMEAAYDFGLEVIEFSTLTDDEQAIWTERL
jgi:hypothetical protein